jgi:hypothetical protein
MLIVHEDGDIQTRRRWMRMYPDREAMGYDVERLGMVVPGIAAISSRSLCRIDNAFLL